VDRLVSFETFLAEARNWGAHFDDAPGASVVTCVHFHPKDEIRFGRVQVDRVVEARIDAEVEDELSVFVRNEAVSRIVAGQLSDFDTPTVVRTTYGVSAPVSSRMRKSAR